MIEQHLTESDDKYERVNVLQTMLCVLKNPAVHLEAEGEWDLEEWQREASIKEIEKELKGVLQLGSAYDLFKGAMPDEVRQLKFDF